MAYRLACETDLLAAIGPVAATMLGRLPQPGAHVGHRHQRHGRPDRPVCRTRPDGGRAQIEGPPVPDVIRSWRTTARCGGEVLSVEGAVPPPSRSAQATARSSSSPSKGVVTSGPGSSAAGRSTPRRPPPRPRRPPPAPTQEPLTPRRKSGRSSPSTTAERPEFREPGPSGSASSTSVSASRSAEMVRPSSPRRRSLTSQMLTFIAAVSAPSRSQKAMNSPPAVSPRTTTSSPGSEYPTYSMPRSNWSV